MSLCLYVKSEVITVVTLKLDVSIVYIPAVCEVSLKRLLASQRKW